MNRQRPGRSGEKEDLRYLEVNYNSDFRQRSQPKDC